MCETNKSISSELITLRVESPAKTAPDLTLIDLPGIARIAVDGQPADICQRIKSIIMQHVQNENAVMLCVISANLDAAVNESIQIAKLVDPEGKRTLGVITKPDMADEENKDEVLCLLNNEKIHLDKGYHMVKCRSQKELENNLSLKDSLENEKIFFENDKYYSTANESQLGTMNLALKITEELVQVIKSTLPDLERKINLKLQDAEKKLMKLPPALPEDDHEKIVFFFGMIKDMLKEINCFLITGKMDSKNENIFHYWRNLFTRFKNEIQDLTNRAWNKEFSLSKLKNKILTNRGNEISGFLNFELFQSLLTTHVMSYKSNAETILKEMKDATNTMICDIIGKNFRHFNEISEDLKRIATSELDLAYKETLKRINTVFDEEKLVFTMDDVFEKEMKELMAALNNNNNQHGGRGQSVTNQNTASGVDYSDASEMFRVIFCYLKIVHFRLSDRIPTTLRQCLHIEFDKTIDRKFIGYSTTDRITIMVAEDKRMGVERKQLQNKIKRLTLALSEIRKL